MRVLLTGAAGGIGTVVTRGLLAAGHGVIGLDLIPAPEGSNLTWHTLDCADPDAVAAVFAEESPQAVVHLAGNPGDSGLEEAYTSHVATTAALLDAMVAHRVDRIVYASSNHAVGLTPHPADGVVGIDARPRPDTFYGAAKVAAEALLSLYVDRHGLDAVACRIGTFLPEPTTRRHLSTWLSPDDTVRMTLAALTAPAPGFAVLYGISANTRAWWDLEPGRELGYLPEDDAEVYADTIEERPEDEAEAAYVGGPFATARFTRPAFDRPPTPGAHSDQL